MGSDRIDIERITDFRIALAILKNEVIVSEIYEDGAFLEIPDLINEYWVAGYIDGNLAGCYRIHPMGGVLWQIHCRILPDFRQKWSEKISVCVLCWSFENIENLQRIMCFVPACHRNVALHCKRVGFRKNGTLSASYVKDGQLVDQDIYSINREKILSFMEVEPCQRQR